MYIRVSVVLCTNLCLIVSNVLYKTRSGINTLSHPVVSSFLSAAIGRIEPQPCLLSQKVDTYFVPEQRIDRRGCKIELDYCEFHCAHRRHDISSFLSTGRLSVDLTHCELSIVYLHPATPCQSVKTVIFSVLAPQTLMRWNVTGHVLDCTCITL